MSGGVTSMPAAQFGYTYGHQMQSPQQGMQGPNPSYDPTLPTTSYAPQSQNPPTGGIAGNQGYSTGYYPQLTGGYWNALSQLLAGPRYQATSGTSGMPMSQANQYGQAANQISAYGAPTGSGNPPIRPQRN